MYATQSNPEETYISYVTNRLEIIQNEKCIQKYLDGIKREKNAVDPHLANIHHALERALICAASAIKMTMNFDLALSQLKCIETAYINKIKTIMNVISYMANHVLYIFASVASLLEKPENKAAMHRICILIISNTDKYDNLGKFCVNYCNRITPALKKPEQLEHVQFDDPEGILKTNYNFMSESGPEAVLNCIVIRI